MTRLACLRHVLSRLGRDKTGATLIEFAMIAPVFLGILMFLFDTGYMLYARGILTGEVNAAGRSSTLETANATTRATYDQTVTDRVQQVVPHGDVTFTRTAFGAYRLAQSRAEPFVDANNNDRCDDGEAFEDLNLNGQYDLDGGRSGGGGAKDVVIYTATLEYTRLFPVHSLLGFDNNVTLTATTLLRNQPFDAQTVPPTRNCT